MTTSEITWLQHAPEIQAIAIALGTILLYVIMQLAKMYYDTFKGWFNYHAEEHKTASEAIQKTMMRLTALETEHRVVHSSKLSRQNYSIDRADEQADL